MTFRLFTILIAVLVTASEGSSAVRPRKGESPYFMPSPLVILTPACAGSPAKSRNSERCRVLEAVAEGARTGALAAIDGRNMLVLTRKEASTALAQYGLPACDEGETCGLDDVYRLNAIYAVTATVTPDGSVGKHSWKIELQLYQTGNHMSVGQRGVIEKQPEAGLRDAVQSLTEKLVRPAVQPVFLARASRVPAKAAARDVLVTFEAPESGIVRVDGKLACVRTPCARLIPEGEHEATFEQTDFAAKTVKFTAEKGAVAKTKLEFAGQRARLAVLVPELRRMASDPNRKQSDRYLLLKGLENDADRGAWNALANRDVEIFSPDTIEDHLNRRGVFAECAEARSCSLETARIIGADYVLTGNVTRVKNGLTASLDLQDVRTGKVVLSRSTRIDKPVDLRNVGSLLPWVNTVMSEALNLEPFAVRFPLLSPTDRGLSKVYFASTPDRAVVSVDGRLACGMVPCFSYLAPGPHQAVFEQFRLETAAMPFEAIHGTTVTGALTPIDFGWIEVMTESADRLRLHATVDDGRQDWTTEKRQGAVLQSREVDAGEVEVSSEGPCVISPPQNVMVKPGERHFYKLPLKKRPAPLEVRGIDENGQDVVAPVMLDSRPAGTTGTRLEVPLCYFDQLGVPQGVRDHERIISVQFAKDTFAAKVVLKENQTTVVTAKAAPVPEPGRMVSLPGGTFTMTGTNRVVTVGPFLLDETEVTAREFGKCVDASECTDPERERDFGWDPIFGNKGFMASGPPRKPGTGCTYAMKGKEHHPVNCVTWDQAAAYCEWKKKRLPTEEEWVWAARWAGQEKRPDAGESSYSRGSCTGGEAWPSSSIKGARGFSHTCRVGAYPGSDTPQGVKDLWGNVSEWTSSIETRDRAKDEEQARGRKVPYSESRVVRGSSWAFNKERTGEPPTVSYPTIGFRCAQNP